MAITRQNDNYTFPLLFVAVLWFIKIFEVVFQTSLSHFGILPRHISGLKGILFSPLIHENFTHLISNSLPLIFMGITVFFFYRKIAFPIFFFIYILTGIGVWLFGKEAYHIGASGVIYGLLTFLVGSGLFRLEWKALIIGILIAFFYGGIIWGVLPSDPHISWEAHLFGAISGLYIAYVYRNKKVS